MRMTCNGCGAESSQDGILKHESSCVTQPQIYEHNTMPSTTIKFDSPVEQKQFMDNLTKGNGMVATRLEANTEPVKSATPTPLTTNEELDKIQKYPLAMIGSESRGLAVFNLKELKAYIDQQTKEAEKSGRINENIYSRSIVSLAQNKGQDLYEKLTERYTTLTNDKQER